ncbi:MAG TPA: hypothetical protein EYP63_05240 [Desulfotomaculum sp.]|nr:hypothetical protein [Desulfotomaculum sp.]
MGRVFDEPQAAAIAKVVAEAAEASQRELVKMKDFSELKEIVRSLGVTVSDLAEAQKRTEQRVEELAAAQRELAEAQKRTEIEIRKLAGELRDTKTEVGGLARSMAYALENEAYRVLPAFLKQQGITITERFMRTEIAGEEINVFAEGKKDGREVIIVGETELKATSVRKLKQLARKAAVVQESYPSREIISLLITHYAPRALCEKAKERGIFVIQSFEWQ